MDVFLLRHGQSEFNIGLTNHLDSSLTPLGRLQAQRAAERLAGENISHIYVSPLRRTLQTIAPFCQLTGLTAEAVPDLREFFSSHLYREFPGMRLDTIGREFPFATWDSHFLTETPWWPSFEETEEVLYTRAVSVRDLLLGQFAQSDKHLLIVSHADTVGRLREAFQHLPPRPDNPPWSDNCGISRLHCSADPDAPASVVYENDTAYLSDLHSE